MAVGELSPFHFRDLADGIQQQMFFWGQDVLHPKGNFFTLQGFHRSPSTGLKGTSCYRKEWREGHIELYGSCAGWYGEGGGFTFIRPQRRCVLWRSDQTTPVPGQWQTKFFETRSGRRELHQASLPFLDWLIDHEQAALANFGHSYRETNYRTFKKSARGKAWLQPADAVRWFQCFRDNPILLERPRNFGHLQHV